MDPSGRIDVPDFAALGKQGPVQARSRLARARERTLHICHVPQGREQ